MEFSAVSNLLNTAGDTLPKATFVRALYVERDV
jgi:hypothetical protein